jgi:signal transduction histidine kinase
MPNSCWDSNPENGMASLSPACEIFLPNIIKLTREKGEFAGELLLRNRRNEEFFAHLTTSPLRQGETEIFIATIRDIGDLKTLQRESTESERLRSMAKVVDQIAHHIRNPIASIGGFASRLLRKDVNEKDKQLYQEIIFQEASRLDGLLKSLSNFTTLPFPAMRNESLDRLLDRALALVPKPLRSTAPECRTPSSAELVQLSGYMDLELLAQALANIITNALESGDPTMAINIQASVKGGRLHLSVTDNGRGIKTSDLPLVFDPLFTTKTGHVGLGLTISQRIIHDHSGKMEIESKVGQGTTVRLDIPRDRRRAIRVRRL